MADIFRIANQNDELRYIKQSAPSVYERIMGEIEEKKPDIIKKGFMIRNAVIEAFNISDNEAVMEKIIEGRLVLIKYFTRKGYVSISGKYSIVGKYCFSFCDFIEELTFEEGVEYIEERIICGKASLKKVDFPASLNAISYDAFRDCGNLQEVIFKNKRTMLSSLVFDNTAWLNGFDDEFVVINGHLIRYNGKAENIVIPEGVTEIEHYLFCGNDRIKTLACPDSLKIIGAGAFSDCKNLEKISLNDNLEVIAPEAFSCCKSLKEVILPDGINAVGFGAFDLPDVNIIVRKNSSIYD